jgi:CRP/FNR family transcriptional regulator
MDKKDVDDRLKSFTEHFPSRTYRRSALLIHQDSPNPKEAYYLTDGYVRMFKKNTEGKMIFIHIFRPGSLLLLPWILTDSVNIFSLDALTPIHVHVIPQKDAKEFFFADQELLAAMIDRLIRGMFGLLERIDALANSQAKEKLVTLLVYLAQKVGVKSNGEIELPFPVSHRELATWIATTRETASLQMEKLGKKGILRYTGRKIIISNLQLLKKELGPLSSKR